MARDKKVERVFLQRYALAKSNVSLSKSVSEEKYKVKKLENEKYVNAKASQTSSLENYEQHKCANALLCKNHACDIESAFAVADEKTNNNIETEKLRLIAEEDYSTNLRTERQQSSGKLKKRNLPVKKLSTSTHPNAGYRT